MHNTSELPVNDQLVMLDDTDWTAKCLWLNSPSVDANKQPMDTSKCMQWIDVSFDGIELQTCIRVKLIRNSGNAGITFEHHMVMSRCGIGWWRCHEIKLTAAWACFTARWPARPGQCTRRCNWQTMAGHLSYWRITGALHGPVAIGLCAAVRPSMALPQKERLALIVDSKSRVNQDS